MKAAMQIGNKKSAPLIPCAPITIIIIVIIRRIINNDMGMFEEITGKFLSMLGSALSSSVKKGHDARQNLL